MSEEHRLLFIPSLPHSLACDTRYSRGAQKETWPSMIMVTELRAGS